MNSRERVLAAFSSKQIPDRVPWVEQIIDEKVISALLGKEVIDPISSEDISTEKTAEYYRAASEVYGELGLDGIGCPAWTPSIRDPVIKPGQAVPESYTPGIRNWETFNQRTKEMPRPADMPLACYAEGWSLGMETTDMFRALAVGMQYRMLEVSIGFENIAVWHMDMPDLLHAAARFFCDWTCEAIRMILDRFPFDTVWLNDDLAFKTATFISPAMLREYVFPYHREIVDCVRSYGLPTMFHSDGNLAAILDDLIDSGFVSVHPLERLAFDIRAARALVGDRIAVMGNVDIDFLEEGDPELCYRETAELIEELGPGRFILASGNSITGNVKPENLKAMSRAVLDQKPRS